ncbi:SprT family zinc-dependent metalloprotease [Thiomicrospira sp. R3]|uniref:M48 family metallopeptidase n=1 Tax=Thiomicrospira sp. R3 TaxID=3035472 RepID=UPI00259BA2CF|nr:SprT family zinc-dependent metalloprotease [Thiomicrospira sp. R3]WFE67896.1 SprT family zinc-dependent metalloprotease [Thiomicrospira sp. R3]
MSFRNGVQLGQLQIPIKTHPRRKRLALRIKPTGEVALLAPPKVAFKQLEGFALANQAWLEEQLSKLALKPQPAVFSGSIGERWPYLGEGLVLEQADAYPVQQQKNKLLLPSHADAKQALFSWYLERVNEWLPSRFNYWAAQTGFQPTGLQIKTYKARWGSCDRHGRIQLNWMLIGLPQWVVDYVIVHELCHLTHMNHSPAFWQLVRWHYPNTEQAKAWLKQNGHPIISQLYSLSGNTL